MRRILLSLFALAISGCGQESPPSETEISAESEFAEIGLPEAAPSRAETLDGSPPLIIAHRGASGELPEHTLAAYERAIDQGADFIEPDLVMTKDGVLIARHDRYLSTTTDVADRPEFADRKRVAASPFVDREDWWAEDFTLAEIKTLRATQPFEGRPIQFDGLFEVPTFDEVLALAVARGVGVYPETKAPSHHASVGLDMVEPMVEALSRSDFAAAEIPVFVQSFEPGILRELKKRGDWPLVQLISADRATIAAGLEPPLDAIAEYAAGVGPNKLFLWDAEGGRSDFVERAHGLGLLVHAWTYRDDSVAEGYADIQAELAATFDQGVDGVFVDFPETAFDYRSGR
ncbi:MAG: glycerophosphodiester phosphodiesterase family protein [Pseudomonadota bacterium]